MDFVLQHNVPNVTSSFLGQTLLRDTMSSSALTLTVDTEADGFEMLFNLEEVPDCWLSVHNNTVTQLIITPTRSM